MRPPVTSLFRGVCVGFICGVGRAQAAIFRTWRRSNIARTHLIYIELPREVPVSYILGAFDVRWPSICLTRSGCALSDSWTRVQAWDKRGINALTPLKGEIDVEHSGVYCHPRHHSRYCKDYLRDTCSVGCDGPSRRRHSPLSSSFHEGDARPSPWSALDRRSNWSIPP